MQVGSKYLNRTTPMNTTPISPNADAFEIISDREPMRTPYTTHNASVVKMDASVSNEIPSCSPLYHTRMIWGIHAINPKLPAVKPMASIMKFDVILLATRDHRFDIQEMQLQVRRSDPFVVIHTLTRYRDIQGKSKHQSLETLAS